MVKNSPFLVRGTTAAACLALSSACILSFTLAGETLANPHTTVLKKNTPTKFAAREELEGSSSVINSFNVPHGCNGTPMRAMSVVFPNGDVDATRADTDEEVDLSEHIMGNPVSPRPIQDRNIFKKTRRIDGPALGGRTTTRAVHYTEGKLEADLVGLIPWRGSFPRFKADSCATKLHVNIAIANYCTKSTKDDDRADIWIGMLTTLFDDPAVVVQRPPGFWPTLAVVRDLDNNPLPAGCGDGFEIEASPSALDIDEYLPIKGYWPAKGSDDDDDD